MADVFSAEKRSRVMAAIRSQGNKNTEIRLAAILRRHGITGWRRGWPLFGRPDFVFPKQRLAVFVDGCFWHGCPVHGRIPNSNGLYWSKKLASNKLRDRRVRRTLEAKGWRVLRIWEHTLMKESVAVGVLRRSLRACEKC